jgi:transcriptional regulator of arginine metabolism
MPERDAARERRAAIEQILREHEVHSQGELLKRLRRRGFRVTQPSVSRDLHDLGVIKADGRYLPAEALGVRESASPELDEAAAYVISWATAGPHLLVVRTPAGTASIVALAVDAAGWPELVGSIAGDDTLFLATPGRRQQARIEGRLARLARRSVHA